MFFVGSFASSYRPSGHSWRILALINRAAAESPLPAPSKAQSEFDGILFVFSFSAEEF
jgi:hypothetical protein